MFLRCARLRHSSLTRIRQRWGEDLFRRVFTRVVQQCQAAGLVSAETVHIDASLIRANVSMDALVTRHLDAVEDVNDAERDARTSGKFKKLYTRHRWRVEGAHGTAQTLHGLARDIRRGLESMKIQALLTAIA